MEILKFFQNNATPFLDNFFQFMSFLGEAPLYLLILITIYWCLDKKTGIRLAFIQLSSAVINNAVKDFVKAPRPIGQEGIISKRVETATGYSFPSGHTQGTATFWTAFMKVYKKTWIYVSGTILIISVAVSRLYLGVHWPIDVVAAIFFGIVSMFAASILVDIAYNTGKSSYFLILVIPALMGLLFFHSEDYFKSVALATSFYIGYIIERKFINFDTKSDPGKQSMKIIIGLLGIAVIMIPLKEILPHNNLGIFIRYSFIGLWIVAAAPYIFLKLGLSTTDIAYSRTKILPK